MYCNLQMKLTINQYGSLSGVKTRLVMLILVSHYLFQLILEDNEITLTPGESKEIKFEINAHTDSLLHPISSSTLTPSGELGASYGIFSENINKLEKG